MTTVGLELKSSELDSCTKKELEEMAAEASIDISHCKTKGDIINAIETSCME